MRVLILLRLQMDLLASGGREPSPDKLGFP